MAHAYDFDERAAMSEGIASSMDIAELLVRQIPGAVAAHRAHISNDRSGTDWWVEMSMGRHLSVDVKSREEDWALRGEDDYALETWSVVERSVPGWTRDQTKQTDFILWVWSETGRWALIPFRPLCKVFQNYWEHWRAFYKTKQQRTPKRGYHSECVFVPRREVWKALYLHFSGKLPPAPRSRQPELPGCRE